MDIRPLPDTAFSPEALRRDRRRLETALFWGAVFVGLLWLVRLAEWAAGQPFTFLGLAPREWRGLAGIIGAPLVHGSLAHLAANSAPTFVLLSLGLYAVPRATLRALPLIWILSGLLVYALGRPSLHIGASGLTHGLMAFLFLLGALRRDRVTLAISFVVFFLYGSMIYGFLPTTADISFEYHGAGLASGVLAAILWRKLDPPPPVRRYSWEDEAEDDGEPASAGGDPLEPPPPIDIQPIWDGPRGESRGTLIRFPVERRRAGDAQDGRPPTRHGG
jgi:membrane associated rhomboid family serine protease